MRKKIVAGNWKMNLNSQEAKALAVELSKSENKPEHAELMIFPPSLYLGSLASHGEGHLKIGAQNFYPAEKGAFTGEVSITQLSSVGVNTVLIGHSERRAYFGEHDDFLKEKVDIAVEKGFHVIFCCGEPLSIREENSEEDFVKNQLINALFHLSIEDIQKVTIAYEPVWAIGTGLTATNEQAEDMHAFIRKCISEVYSLEIANIIPILYGGSCNASNARELFACPNVDGGLIGGASLEASTFLQIANSF